MTRNPKSPISGKLKTRIVIQMGLVNIANITKLMAASDETPHASDISCSFIFTFSDPLLKVAIVVSLGKL